MLRIRSFITDTIEFYFFLSIVYIYIFQPPVVNKILYIIIEFIIFLLFFITKSQLLLRIYNLFRIELLFLLLIIIYALVRDIFVGDIVYSDRFIAWTFQSFIFGIIILIYFERKKVDFFRLAYLASFIASLLTIALLLIPSFDKWYETIQLDAHYDLYKNFEQRYRAYGISENLTFTYAVVMGFFSGYSFLLLKKSYVYLIPFFTCLLATIFNARIGLLVIIFFLFYSFIIRINLKFFIRFIMTIVILFLSSVLVFSNLGINPDKLVIFSNIEWVLEFFFDIFSSQDNKKSTIDVLFNKFIILPDETLVEIIFGTGKSLFGLVQNSSDVGYILQLYYGGVIFLLLILSFLIYLCVRLIKILGLSNWYTGFFITIIPVLNIKGFVFAATPGGRLFFLLYIFFILKKIYSKNKFIL